MRLNKIIEQYLWEQNLRKSLTGKVVPTTREADELIMRLKQDQTDIPEYLKTHGIEVPPVKEEDLRSLIRSVPEIMRRVKIEEAKEILRYENPNICTDECFKNKAEIERNQSIARQNYETMELFARMSADKVKNNQS
jgi:hypothetical protein